MSAGGWTRDCLNPTQHGHADRLPDAVPPYDNNERAWIPRLAERLPATAWRTRFAPAPTGYLHLGHIVNALYVWGIAQAYGGQVVLRIEDHDRGRCRKEYEAALLDDLDWLGFVPDIGETDSFRNIDTTHPLRQSNNPDRYAFALKTLEAKGVVYPCVCSRRSIALKATSTGGDPLRYPGTCRYAHVDGQRTTARRIRLGSWVESFDDIRCGPQSQCPELQCGDVLLRDAHNNWTYQFAVTLDDMHQHIDVVIRGEDLLESTGRQYMMAAELMRSTPPVVLHHPLLLRHDGAKLSKSNGDTGIRECRAAGESAESLLGRVAYEIGLAKSRASIAAKDLASLFLPT